LVSHELSPTGVERARRLGTPSFRLVDARAEAK
jgi:hypothetical protein